jgi:signal transduction histidine kinase
VAVVIFEKEAARALKWHLEKDEAGAPPGRTRRVELTTAERAAWLFDDGGRAWHATRDDAGQGQTWATEPDVWPLAPRHIQVPSPVLRAHAFRTITAVNLGLADEWHGRVYLFDVAPGSTLPPMLHFLEALAEHITPALTNAFLMRRLRARAGAAERARVARELHDGTIQALFGVDMKIEAIRRSLPAQAPEAAELTDIQRLLQREVLALRELMQALRPIELDSGDQLPEALASLVERFRRDSGISARFLADGPRVSLAPARAIELVRITQEALVNVRKHSRAQNVLVRLTTGEGTCSLMIEDDGCGSGFEGRLTARELDERHVGPAMIKERARLAGAQLSVHSSPGAGTRVEVAFGEPVHA